MSTEQNDDAATSPDSAEGISATRPQPRYGAYAPADTGDRSGSGSGAETESTETYNPYAQPTWGQPGGSSGTDSYGYNAGGSNPYGSNPYGSDPYQTQQQSYSGAGQSSWQQPSAQQGSGPYAPPQQPGTPSQDGYPAQQRPKRPATLWTALTALLTAGVTSMIWGFYVFVTIPAQTMSEVFGTSFSEILAEEMERQAEVDPTLQELTAQELEEATLVMIGVLALLWAAVLLALYITTAFLGAMAGNPGRIIATIWAGLSLLFLTFGHDGASYGIISATIAFSVVAIVMMWLPASSKYIRYRKWEKETLRSGYYPPYPSQQYG